MEISEEFVRRVNSELKMKDIPVHARSSHVALAWMRENGYCGDFLNRDIWEPIEAIFETMYPRELLMMPAPLIGGVVLDDSMYIVTLPIVYGTVRVDYTKFIDIPRSRLEAICKDDISEFWQAMYAVADLFDFSDGQDALKGKVKAVDDMLTNAKAAIASTAGNLCRNEGLETITQSTCVAAELALKSALSHCGWDDNRLRSLSHDLPKAADALICEKPTKDDDALRTACSKFPNYVASRYGESTLSRSELLSLGLRSQYVAAEAVRRISPDQNSATQVADDPRSLERAPA